MPQMPSDSKRFGFARVAGVDLRAVGGLGPGLQEALQLAGEGQRLAPGVAAADPQVLIHGPTADRQEAAVRERYRGGREGREESTIDGLIRDSVLSDELRRISEQGRDVADAAVPLVEEQGEAIGLLLGQEAPVDTGLRAGRFAAWELEVAQRNAAGGVGGIEAALIGYQGRLVEQDR